MMDADESTHEAAVQEILRAGGSSTGHPFSEAAGAATTALPTARNTPGSPFGDEEEMCGVCLEIPPEGCFVELWCCGNTLCVDDAQQLGKCPFCREEPLAWNIIK